MNLVIQSSRRKRGMIVMVLRPLACVIVLSTQLSGCSKGPARADPVDPERAREALRTALDSWKKREKAAALQQGSPAITVQDMDWDAGLQLVSYQLVGEGTAYDANLHCQVKLTLRDLEGTELKKEVTYIVGTSPVLTVFRQLF